MTCICCKVPQKTSVPPDMTRGPPSGKPMTSAKVAKDHEKCPGRGIERGGGGGGLCSPNPDPIIIFQHLFSHLSLKFRPTFLDTLPVLRLSNQTGQNLFPTPNQTAQKPHPLAAQFIQGSPPGRDSRGWLGLYASPGGEEDEKVSELFCIKRKMINVICQW